MRAEEISAAEARNILEKDNRSGKDGFYRFLVLKIMIEIYDLDMNLRCRGVAVDDAVEVITGTL